MPPPTASSSPRATLDNLRARDIVRPDMSQRIGWSRILILVLLAVVCAAVSNLAASKERKMGWVGTYSRALDASPAAGETASVPVSAPAVSQASSTALAPAP